MVMRYLEGYLSELKKKLPDVEERLNAGADEQQLRNLRLKLGCEIPDELLSLYQCFDGEDLSEFGFFAGMRFLSVKGIRQELDFFQSTEAELTAMGTGAIQEKPMCKLNWIPFAFDGSRAWLVMDLSPAESGKAGQIITVDYDADQCYLLADGMDDLLNKMTLWFQNGILTVNRENADSPFIMERSGHLFNSLEELAVLEQSSDALEIPLPEGFWQERYKHSSVPVSSLGKEKKMLLKGKEIDCSPFAYMTNMKELILHDCHLTNLSALARMQQLKRLIFAGCTFAGENLSALSGAPALKELGLNVMSGAGLAELSGLKPLKCLQVRALTDMETEELSSFTALQELRIENMGLRNAAFIGGMKSLKKLDLCNSELENLDFLKDLKKLTEFKLSKSADNEDGLAAVSGLTRLKEFIYPVKDLSIYEGLEALECAGMADSVTEGFEVFAGSRVSSFTLLGAESKRRLEEVRLQMEKYVKLYSWGAQG